MSAETELKTLFRAEQELRLLISMSPIQDRSAARKRIGVIKAELNKVKRHLDAVDES